MDDDRLNPVMNRLDGLESRLKAVEDQKRHESCSWMAKISRVGIVVGCLGGILGGASILWNLWKEVGAKPDIVLVPGAPIDVLWKPEERRLSFKCGLVLANNARASGVVTAARAYVQTATLAPLLDFQSILFNEKSSNLRPPFSVQASATREVEISITSELTPEKEQEFRKTGLYYLILEFETSQLRRQVPYCFWLGDETTNDLFTTGVLTYTDLDPRCLSSDT
jgi:hypothetical protein